MRGPKQSSPFLRSVVLLLLVLALSFAAPTRGRAATAGGKKIVLGALLSLTGTWSSLGIASQAALQIAVERMNEEFAQTGSPTRVELVVKDTKLDPATAAADLQELIDRHVTIVVGPQSSAELTAVKPIADAKGILVISQGSTASSLAVPDTIFRFCPSDVHEGAATAALMEADGVETVVAIWRHDPGNQGLVNSMRISFTSAGGAFANGIIYEPDTTDFSSFVATLGDEVRSAKAAGRRTAVYLAAFDEGVNVLKLAAADSDLASVHWYAGDGLTLNSVVLADADAAAFASIVGLDAPNFGLDPSAADISGPLSAEIEARVGYAPDAYALAAYDAAWMAVLARQEAKGKKNTARLVAAFTHNADRYWGATGPTELDANGDRSRGNYDFFRVVSGPQGFAYAHSASYVNGEVIPAD